MSGPPKIICNICNQEVLKSQTYFVGNGRACKSHQGVTDTSAELQADESKRKREEREDQKRRQSRNSSVRRKDVNPMYDVFETVRLSTGTVKVHRCWNCEAKGIHVQDLFLSSSIALKRRELRGDKFNFFTMSEDIKKELRVPEGYTSINTIQIADKDIDRIEKRLNYKFQGLVSYAKMIACCPSCAEKLGLEFIKPLPSISLEAMFTLGAVMDPMITDKAKQSLENDKNIN